MTKLKNMVGKLGKSKIMNPRIYSPRLGGLECKGKNFCKIVLGTVTEMNIISLCTNKDFQSLRNLAK